MNYFLPSHRHHKKSESSYRKFAHNLREKRRVRRIAELTHLMRVKLEEAGLPAVRKKSSRQDILNAALLYVTGLEEKLKILEDRKRLCQCPTVEDDEPEAKAGEAEERRNSANHPDPTTRAAVARIETKIVSSSTSSVQLGTTTEEEEEDSCQDDAEACGGSVDARSSFDGGEESTSSQRGRSSSSLDHLGGGSTTKQEEDLATIDNALLLGSTIPIDLPLLTFAPAELPAASAAGGLLSFAQEQGVGLFSPNPPNLGPPVAVCGLDGLIMECSSSFLHSFHLTQAEVVFRRRFQDFCHFSDVGKVERLIRQVASSGNIFCLSTSVTLVITSGRLVKADLLVSTMQNYLQFPYYLSLAVCFQK